MATPWFWLGVILLAVVSVNYFATKAFVALVGGIGVWLKRCIDSWRRERSLRKLPPEIPRPPV